MPAISLVSILVTGSINIGGNAGIALPALNLTRYHASAATVGTQIGWTSNRFSLELGYSYAGLPGRPQGVYYLTLHNLTLCAAWEFLHRQSWGLELSLGGGTGFVRRTFGQALETGRAPSLLTGLGFVQQEGRSRFRLAFTNALFLQTPGGRLDASWIPQLRAHISYVL